MEDEKEKNLLITRDFKKAIRNYKPQLKAWSFLYGDDLISTLCVASSFHITHYFRKEVKIRPHYKFSCYFPVCGIPAVFIDLLHRFWINPKIISGTYCAPCLITKAAVLQGTMGVIYPLVFAPVVTFSAADRLLTYPVPSLSVAPREVYNMWSKMLQKNTKVFVISGAIQMIGAAFITWQKIVFMDKFITAG